MNKLLSETLYITVYWTEFYNLLTLTPMRVDQSK
jgi:hypothetical protein